MRLLLIEDDGNVVEALRISLGRLDHRVTATDADPGDELGCLVAETDAVILDIGLPGEDGFGLCRRIRAFSPVPIIMLTARSDDIDVVAGLEAGADDYVVKPVGPRVLDARIKATVRRATATAFPAEPTNHPAPENAALEHAPAPESASTPTDTAYPADAPQPTHAPESSEAAAGLERVRDLVIDRGAAEIRRGGVPLDLSPTEKRLIYAFIDHPNQVLARDQLLTLAWGHSYLGDSRVVDNAIQRLRAKLDVLGQADYIDTVRGFGYRFVP